MKLSQDGKKAELVTRILEQQNGSSDSASGAAATATSDKGAASSAGGTATTAAVEEVTAGNATATGGVEAAQSNNTNATQEEKKDTKQEESLPLPAASNKDSEAEKRINRLKRFGNPDDIAKLERAEKFGTQADAVDEKVSSIMLNLVRAHTILVSLAWCIAKRVSY